MLLIVVVGYTLMIGGAGIMRFKLPIIPFYIPFAAVGLALLPQTLDSVDQVEIDSSLVIDSYPISRD